MTIKLIFLYNILYVLVYTIGSPIADPEQLGIVGGNVSAGIPYQVSIHKDGELWCSGTILKPQVILTAAHCFRNKFVNDSTVFTIRAGTKKPNTGGQVRLVEEIKTHQLFAYTNDVADNDVAVLKLNDPLNMKDSKVKTVKVISSGTILQPGTKAIVSGWGKLAENGTFPDTLMQARVRIQPRDYCKLHDPEINDNMICAGYKKGGVDSCHYDSGGPLVAKGKQIGIVSWGNGCGLPKHAGVYTNLAAPHIRDFIDKTVETYLK